MWNIYYQQKFSPISTCRCLRTKNSRVQTNQPQFVLKKKMLKIYWKKVKRKWFIFLVSIVVYSYYISWGLSIICT